MANDELRRQTVEERTTKPKHQADQKARLLLRELETQKKKKLRELEAKGKRALSLLDTCHKMGIGGMTWHILETFETVGDNSGRIRRGASLRKFDSRNGKDDKATPVGGSQRERRSLLDVAGDREIVTQFEIKRSWIQGECIALCSCNRNCCPKVFLLILKPNAETEDNVTPLLSAVAAGSMACLELLVKAGAKANVFAGGELTHCYIFHSSLQKQRGKAQKQKQEDKTHSIFPSTLTHKSYLLLKRSLCWLRLGQVKHALSDAKVCRELKPDWPKECFREGAALHLLQVKIISILLQKAFAFEH
ncbi:unnamed protein product [Brassica oleracea]